MTDDGNVSSGREPFTTGDYWRIGAAIRRHGAAEGAEDVPVTFHIPRTMLADTDHGGDDGR